MYPLLLGVYRDYQIGTLSWRALVEILEQLQSLYLRKMVVGADRDHLAAQLCRKRRQYGYPIRAIARRTPSDERVREALAYRPVPHAKYVLDRIDEPSDRGGLQIEHIFPQFPRDTWSGDGDRQWSVFSEMERAKYREILPTIGNLALLEPELNAGASNRPFLDKKRYYEKSKIGSTRGLARTTAWDLQAIAERTRTLTEKFLEIWKHPSIAPTDDLDDLVPILDVQRKPGYYKGWKTEFDYAVFQGDIWEVRDVKTLFRRVFNHLWDTKRTEILAYSSAHDGPIFETQQWASQWVALGSHYLFMGLFPQHMLGVIQGVLDELDIADDVFVK